MQRSCVNATINAWKIIDMCLYVSAYLQWRGPTSYKSVQYTSQCRTKMETKRGENGNAGRVLVRLNLVKCRLLYVAGEEHHKVA